LPSGTGWTIKATYASSNSTLKKLKKLDALSKSALKKIRFHEKEHKSRKTLPEWLDRRIESSS
jgi:hypothetical protein